MIGDMQNLQVAVDRFARERGWGVRLDPKSLSLSIMIEAAELGQLFQWTNTEESCVVDPPKMVMVRHELADVIIYCCNMANILGIDLGECVSEKMAINELKYPRASEPDAKATA